MICDIERLVGRLIAKADKLIGEGVNMIMYNNDTGIMYIAY